MKFSSKEDIEAPIEQVFEMLSEFEAHERSAMRRGIDVRRVDPARPVGTGLAWDARFMLRGKQRDLRLNLVDFDRPTAMRVHADGKGVEGVMSFDLMALSQKRTRVAIALDLKPKTLPARLLIQSLRLAKANLTKRFKLRFAEYAKFLEDRHQRGV